MSIRAIAEQAVRLEPAGAGRWRGLCPFHAEQTPSFHIDEPSGVFCCFGCGALGDADALQRVLAERREDAQAETDLYRQRGGRAR
jgi:DNA primase